MRVHDGITTSPPSSDQPMIWDDGGGEHFVLANGEKIE